LVRHKFWSLNTDAVFTIAVPAQVATAKFYNDCVVKKQLKARDIVEEMKVAVRSRPELYSKPATGVMLASLVKLCGTPIPEWDGDTAWSGCPMLPSVTMGRVVCSSGHTSFVSSPIAVLA
jgi:hypothetical protein